MTLPAHYLWLDLETTGLDMRTASLLEIGAVLCDSTMSTVSTFACLAAPPEGWTEYADYAAIRMHQESGLVEEAQALGVHPVRAWCRLLDWLDMHTGIDSKVALAGSGVSHFDLPFIKTQGPGELVARFHYWTLDVGVMRRTLEQWGVPFDPGASAGQTKAHRALADAKEHLDEYRRMRKLFADAMKAAVA